MGKKDDIIKKLKLIIDDPEKLGKYIIENSHLPGPRANLELAFGLSEIFDDLDLLLKWTNITEDQAGDNDPKSFLVFCAAVCLGKIYIKKKAKKIIAILKKLANDRRWRIREAVAFGFQNIGEHDFSQLKSIFSEWIEESNNLEKRAILVSLAHPKFLDEGNSEFCFAMTDTILRQMDKEEDFDILRKGLNFAISVFAAAHPKLGFNFIKEWMGKDEIIDGIMKENLKKNRLLRKYPEEVRALRNNI